MLFSTCYDSIVIKECYVRGLRQRLQVYSSLDLPRNGSTKTPPPNDFLSVFFDIEGPLMMMMTVLTKNLVTILVYLYSRGDFLSFASPSYKQMQTSK